jgi:hypothetical protein
MVEMGFRAILLVQILTMLEVAAVEKKPQEVPLLLLVVREDKEVAELVATVHQ